MKITEIKVVIEDDLRYTDCYILTIIIFPETGPSIGRKVTYPKNHLRSLFDMIWEDIGKELKEKIMEEDKDVRAGF